MYQYNYQLADFLSLLKKTGWGLILTDLSSNPDQHCPVQF